MMTPEEHQYLRYRLLRTLQLYKRAWTSELSLFRALRSTISLTETDIAVEIVYLREGGYIETRLLNDQALGQMVRQHRLLNQGVDLLQGIPVKGDPGIYSPDRP